MSLELSPEVEKVVRERAAQEGVSVDDLLARTFLVLQEKALSIGDPKERVRALLTKWQTEDNTPLMPPISTRNGETPTQALFRKWEEEDTKMTEEERQAEDRLWDDIQQDIDAERARAGMRTLF